MKYFFAFVGLVTNKGKEDEHHQLRKVVGDNINNG